MPRKKKLEDGSVDWVRGDRGFKEKKPDEPEHPTKWKRKPAKKKGEKGAKKRWSLVKPPKYAKEA